MSAGHRHDAGKAQPGAEAWVPCVLAVGHGDVLGAVDVGLGDGQVPETLQAQLVRQCFAGVGARQFVGSLGLREVHVVAEDLAPHHERQHTRPVAALGCTAIMSL